MHLIILRRNFQFEIVTLWIIKAVVILQSAKSSDLLSCSTLLLAFGLHIQPVVRVITRNLM